MTTPSYSDNDPRGWCGDPSRGAALGRSTYHAEDPAEFTGKLYIARIILDGDYDINGTYWGGGGDNLYWCASEGGEVDYVDRAGNRARMHAAVKAKYPVAKLVTGPEIEDFRWWCPECDNWPLAADIEECPGCGRTREDCEMME